MSEPSDSFDVPDRTIAQAPPASTQAAPRNHETAAAPSFNEAEAGGTLAAPQDYKPGGAASQTSAKSKSNFQIEAAALAGRYAILRALAKGGMGQVSIARDTELDRDIALKEIQPKFRLDSATLHRFLLEARVTGRLEHPGIVPVYGLGSYADGRPYYAMRFITGDSFQQAIDEFHLRDAAPRDPRERSLALRKLLRRFVDVCNTIAYAHSRGILHRDIKPANVMLGEFGETLVVDWGLAKEMAALASIPAVALSDAAETALSTPVLGKDYEETLEGFTLHGQTMGTPAYMSPEQAAGKWDVTGIASDVYSLGAMLYALLSGAPPYSGPSYEVITKVQRGDYTPAKLVKGNTPAPLDAICRKAMAFEIGDRYRTGQDLAADIERWLADEPVSCWREPFVIRASRWARRHRTAVSAAAVLLVTGTAALAVGLVAVNRERREKEKAFVAASESRGEAREALHALTDDAMGEILASSAKPTPQQAKFLDGIIDRYRHFAEKEPDGLENKLFIAGAWYRIGRMEARVERFPKAEESYAQALKLLDDPQFESNAMAIRTRGSAELYGGIVSLKLNRPDAEAKLQSALQTFQQLVRLDGAPEHLALRAQAQDRLGVLLKEKGRKDEAEKLFRESLRTRQSLATNYPGTPEYAYRTAQSLRQLAGIAASCGDRKEALDLAKQARTIQESLLKDNATSVPYLALMADVETVLTVLSTEPRVAVQGGEPKATDALNYARQAANTWGRLAALNPGDSAFRRSLAEAQNNLARHSGEANRPREALASLEAAAAILKDLRAEQPGNALTEVKYAQALVSLATFLHDASDKRAAEAGDKAVEAADAAAKQFPTLSEAHTYAAMAHNKRALIRLAAGKRAEAKADLDAAAPHLPLSKYAPAIQEYLRTCADLLVDEESLDPKSMTATAHQIAQSIVAIPLPAGESHFLAAAFHGRNAKLMGTSENANDPDWQKYALTQLGWSIQRLKDAAAAGFTRADLAEADPDFAKVRETAEYQAVLDSFKAKPKAKEN